MTAVSRVRVSGETTMISGGRESRTAEAWLWPLSVRMGSRQGKPDIMLFQAWPWRSSVIVC